MGRDGGGRTTFVDESVHDDAGLYVVAGVSAAADLRGAVDAALRALVPRSRRPHWRAEDLATRKRLVGVVAQFDVEIYVYGCRFTEPSRKEAARARALEWLVGDVLATGDLLVLDARTEQQDKRDRRLLSRLGGRPPRFGYEHVRSRLEPLLWLPDVAAGAIAAHWVRGAAYDQALLRRLVVAECEPGSSSAKAERPSCGG